CSAGCSGRSTTRADRSPPGRGCPRVVALSSLHPRAATLGPVRFLFSRRWVLFALTVGLMAWGATLLGQWQFHRLDERRSENSLLKRNLVQPPVPIADLMSVSKAPSDDHEWRKVIVHGTWDDPHTIVLKYQ